MKAILVALGLLVAAPAQAETVHQVDLWLEFTGEVGFVFGSAVSTDCVGDPVYCPHPALADTDLDLNVLFPTLVAGDVVHLTATIFDYGYGTPADPTSGKSLDCLIANMYCGGTTLYPVYASPTHLNVWFEYGPTGFSFVGDTTPGSDFRVWKPDYYFDLSNEDWYAYGNDPYAQFTVVPSPVPLPAGLPLLMGCIAILGVTRWRFS